MPRRKGVSLSDQIGQLRGIAQSMPKPMPPVNRATAIQRATGEGVRAKAAPNLREPVRRPLPGTTGELTRAQEVLRATRRKKM